MAKVLITGASGFIGKHLVEALVRRGAEVTCLVRKTSPIEPLQAWEVHLVFGEITDLGSLLPAVAGQAFVYHLAGVTKALTRNHYFQINQRGVGNIVQACAAATPPPILTIVSSLAAAGPALDGHPRVESDPPLPVSDYGRSKRGGELEAESRAARLPITVVRPPIVFGEGDRMTLPIFQIVHRFGIHLVPGLGRHRFSLIHADDLAELLIRAGERGRRLADPRVGGSAPKGRGYYFAACEEAPLYDDLGRLIAQVLGRRSVFPLHVATPLVWLLSCGFETCCQIGRKPSFLGLDKAREITAGSWICSPEAAIQDLDFHVAAPLRERLRQTADWYHRKGWL